MVCYKSSIKKSVVFQDTSNDQSDYNFLKNVHLQNAIGTQLTWNIWKKMKNLIMYYLLTQKT